MSFALLCKEELINKKYLQEQLNMIILGMKDAASNTENEFYTSNKMIADFFYNNVLGKKEIIELPKSLSKYKITYENQNADYSLVEKYRSYYLAGMFIARGSVNDPNTTKYHFEITLSDSKKAVYVLNLINIEPFNAKLTKRRNKYVIYIKDAEKIVDILRVIGVINEAFNYEDIRIRRDFNNSVNRVINCEVANEQKAYQAAREQLRYIKYLEYNYPLETLDIKLLTLMKARKDNPEATLNELIEIMQNKYGETISKSGLYHRFSKIKSIADEHYKNTKR